MIVKLWPQYYNNALSWSMWQMGLKPKEFMCPVICFMDMILTVMQRCNKGWQNTKLLATLGLIDLSVSVEYLHYLIVF